MGNFLFSAIQGLAEHRVDFVLCGGLACVLHGSERTTFDIDILVRMDADNLQRFIRFAHAHGFTPRIPEPLESLLNPQKRREWICEKGALLYTLALRTAWRRSMCSWIIPFPFPTWLQGRSYSRPRG